MVILRHARMLFVAAILTGLVVSTLSAQEAERYSLAGNAVSVYNLAGEVQVMSGSGSSVVVEVVRGGDEAGKLSVERRDVDGRAALVVRYPDDDVVYRGGSWRGNTTLDVRDDGTFFGKRKGGDRIRIRSSGSGLEAHADLRIRVPQGKSVAVYLGVGKVGVENVNGDLLVDVASASVASSGTRGALHIDTGSGSVRVADAEGDVSIDTGSGSVSVNGVRGGRLKVDTGSGSVDGGAVAVDNLDVDTGSGRIGLDGVAARDIRLDTGSGGVRLGLTTDVERLRIDTGSGGVRVSVPEALGVEFVIDTGSGGIEFEVPATLTRRSRDRVEGRLGDGRGSMMIDTGSGGVRVTRS